MPILPTAPPPSRIAPSLYVYLFPRRERKLITKIQDALKRMDDGEYGICEECGEDISLARLKARPVTTLCVSCKARQEEGEKIQGS